MSNVLIAPSLGKITFDGLTAGVSTQSALTASAQITYDGNGAIGIASYNTAGTERLTVDGVNGRLFTVSDTSSGSIFSVNDISGLPIIDVNSGTTDIIKIGTYGTNALVVNNTKVGIGTATPSEALQIVGNQTTSGAGIFGVAKIGSAASYPTMGRFGLSTFDNSTGYGFMQGASGETYISSPTGQTISLRINNVSSATINGSGTSSTSTTTGALVVTGGVGISSDLRVGGGIVIEGSLASGGLDFAGYRNAGNNLTLKGNSTGVSGIFFQSEKDGTNINHSSDYGYIQFHAYGIDGSVGEANKLVIGVANDSDDLLVLQSPYKNGVKISFKDAATGTGGTEYTVWHAGNHGASSGLDADLLDGQHGTYYATDSLVAHLAGTETFTGAKTFSGLLTNSSGRLKNIQVKTTNYTLVSTDHIIVANNSSTFTLTLPAASSNSSREYILKNKGTATVTIDATSSGLLDGQNTTTIPQYSAITVISDGSTWNIF